MRNFIAGVIVTVIGAFIVGAIVWIVVLPQMDWSATKTPGAIEQTLAQNVVERWLRRNAGSATNPLSETPENLKAAQGDYEEHCAACHALDGSATNQFEADFHPPVMKLTEDVQKLSDAELYFVIAKGISNTGMPGFGKEHSPDDIWHFTLWVRHLAKLTPTEKEAIESQMKEKTGAHERTMDHHPDHSHHD